MTVENCGRQVTIERAPQRLYVIGGEAGTLVHAAGGADRVAVFAPLKDEPLGAAAEPLGRAEQQPIKNSKDISREVIIGAAPDMVVTFGLNDFGPDELAAAGIPTLIVSGYCGGFGAGQSDVHDPLEELYRDVETLGRVLGTEQQAKDAVTGLRGRVDAVREKARQSPPADTATAALFIAGPDAQPGAYGKRSMIHQQMESVGLVNVFAGTDERYFEPNTEALIKAAPQRIVALYEAADTTEDAVRRAVTGRADLAAIPAVASDDILVLDFFYSGHGTLAVDGLEQLAAQLAA
ncbi:ABC transporter substrate-binding protein [Actinokineospora sp. UTMC 2448]|uniref:ABC transporter substrate-binding protein n=1 Tax=Actinokineospora sp. UTMC 2448 TaxID=2268449 RepID=UPI002164DFC6|nr:ABC transporter substrate-binding protein [Actinokineospora sp. UTMC 2448]